MPITVACTCGKRFKTADENAGRRARCSACGAVVRVPAAPPAIATADVENGGSDEATFALQSLAAQSEVFRPAAIARPAAASITLGKDKSAKKPPPSSSADRSRAAPEPAIRMVTISPLYVVLAILAVVLPATFYAVKQGPLKAGQQWTERSRVAEDQIPDQIIRAMKQFYRNSGLLGAGESALTYSPKIFVITFGEPKIMMSLPDRVLFSGRGTEGTFEGHFNPQTMTFDATILVGGATHAVTGSASEENNSVQLDGKEVTVH